MERAYIKPGSCGGRWWGDLIIRIDLIGIFHRVKPPALLKRRAEIVHLMFAVVALSES